MLVGDDGCLGELLGEVLLFGSYGLKVGFCSFGADAEGGSYFFERDEAGVCCGAVFFAFTLGVGSDEGDFPRWPGPGPGPRAAARQLQTAAAAVDLFGKVGYSAGDALVGGRASCIHLDLGRFGVSHGAKFGDGAGKGLGVLGGQLFQLADEFGGASQADGHRLTAGFLSPLAGGLGFPLAAFAVGREGIMAGVCAVFRLRAAVAGRRGYVRGRTSVSVIRSSQRQCTGQVGIRYPARSARWPRSRHCGITQGERAWVAALRDSTSSLPITCG
jgi:hypothetical protein